MSINKLSQSAQGLKPDFDPALHDQVMRRVQQARIQHLRKQSTWRSYSYKLGGAVAAMVAIGLILFNFTIRGKPQTEQLSSMIASLKESTQPINQQLAEPIRSAARQFSLLREDAIDLGRFVTDQFKLIPTENRAQDKPM